MHCQQCDKDFNAKRSTAKFCSAACRVAHNRLSVTEAVPVGVSVTKPLQRAPGPFKQVSKRLASTGNALVDDHNRLVMKYRKKQDKRHVYAGGTK